MKKEPMTFSDIILKHKQSILKSRSDADTTVKCKNLTLNSPVCLSNMPSCQNKDVLSIFNEYKWPYVYHRLGGASDIHSFVSKINLENWYLKSISVGVSEQDKQLLTQIKRSDFKLDWITIDVALIYNIHFEDYIKWVRKEFPDVYLIAGNFNGSECSDWLYNLGVDCGKHNIGVSELCFEGDTLIMTDRGLVTIKDINIGDYVLTHNNRYKIVEDVIKKYSSDLIKVNGQICTLDHKFYVIDKSDEDVINDENIHDYAYWLKASDINDDKHLLITLD